jgi:hypothetical protein
MYPDLTEGAAEMGYRLWWCPELVELAGRGFSCVRILLSLVMECVLRRERAGKSFERPTASARRNKAERCPERREEREEG